MTSLNRTAIPYAGYGWALTTGCTKTGPACLNCYAARLAATRLNHRPEYAGLALKLPPYLDCHNVIRPTYDWTGEVRFHSEQLDRPLHTRKPGLVFTVPTGDLFHEGVTDEQVYSAFAVMAATPHLTYVIVTKRPERMHRLLSDRSTVCREIILADCRIRGVMAPLSAPWPLPNVWLVPTVWDQESADRVIPLLLDTPAAVRGISYEPALGALDPTPWLPCPTTFVCPDGDCESPWACGPDALDWVICGPETGPGRRPFDPAWAEAVHAQCVAAGVPYFDKREAFADWREMPEVSA